MDSNESPTGSPRTVERRKQKIRQIMENDFEENLFHVKSLTAKKCVKFFGTSQIPLDKLTFNNNNNNTSGEEKLLCAGCAYPLDAHKEAAEQVNIKPWTRDTLRWRENFCIYNIDQALIGKIRFLNEVENIDKLANFAVMANNTSPGTVVKEILMKKFELTKPNLVISFAGSHSRVQITEERQVSRFKQGFLNAATSTKSWILTGGTTLGIDGYITDLLNERIYQEWIGVVERTFSLIGIANWNCVDQHEQILQWYIKKRWAIEESMLPAARKRKTSSKKPSWKSSSHIFETEKDYPSSGGRSQEELAYNYRCRVTKASPRDKLQKYSFPLNPQNINLILADCGIKDKTKQEVSMRCDIETFISHENGLNTPLVLILVGGEYDCFERAARALANSIPVVVCEGSGDAADILTLAIKLHITNSKYTHQILTALQCQKIASIMERNFHQSSQKKHGELFSMDSFTPATYIHYIAECCRKKDLVVIYKIDDPDYMLDEAILKALFCVARKGTDNLQLAMEWGRCDENVRLMLANEPDINYRHNINALMHKAFSEQKLEFVKAFMEYGLDMKSFLKPAILARLYQDTCFAYPPFLKLLRTACGWRSEYNINDVYTLIKKRTSAALTHKIKFMQGRRMAATQYHNGSLSGRLTNSFHPRRNHLPKVLFEDPFLELALWSTFSNRLDSAKFYWERCNSQLMLALIISELWRLLSTALPANDNDARKKMIENEQLFNDMANDILTVCSSNNKDLCQQLLLYKDSCFGYKNCIDIAGYCDAKNFIANNAVQAAINSQWKNTLRCSNLDIICGLLCPFYVSKIEYDKQHSSHKQDYDFKNEESFDFSSANKITRNAHNDVTLTPLLNNSSSNIIDIEVQSESSKVEEMKTKIRLEKPTKYGRFLSAPITKFTIHVTAYLVFLALFTYYYLYKITRDHYNAFQIAQLSFLVAHGIDEISQLVLDKAAWSLKMRLWLKSEWNVINMFYISFGILAFPLSQCEATFKLAKVIYGPVVFFMWLRLLRFYQVSPKVGPIWIMIRKMLVETLIFLSVFLLVIIACGIVIFLYNVEEFGERNYTDIQWLLLRPFFMTIGHTFHKTIEGGRHPFLTEIVVVCFLFLGNALILNLLVALYGSVYNKISENSSTEWKYEMFWMLEEYKKKTFLPPPISIFERILQILKYLRHKEDSGVIKKDPDHKILKQFEVFCTYESLRKKSKSISTEQYVEKLLILEEDQTRRIKDCAANLSLCRITIQNNLDHKQRKRREKKAKKERQEKWTSL
ncbi:transient receptor potential cation channel subfamily M member 3-like isoform X2 [Convolutriloba macropyga]|uniref:transient receptor potential cation channel subfamily M member 3-like isoform X2 n=1 Tax=Convolutriloba macropyga TaxID=536237 RepID=UPI003F51D90A